MRTLALCLLLAPALLCALPGPVQAGDEDADTARLERRVEMLIDLVAELRTEVLALRERVAQLEERRVLRDIVVDERALPGVPVEPKVERIPATPIVPAPIVVWPDVSGVYGLDRDATVEAILKAQLEDVEDEEMAEMIRKGIVEEFEQVSITLRIEKNGTFFVRLDGLEEDAESTARGTWKRDETHIGPAQRLLLLTTHEDGVEDDDPTELDGTWEDGRLLLRAIEANEVRNPR